MKPPGSERKRAARAGSGDVRAPRPGSIAGWPARQQDRAVAGERPQRRAALGAPGEARRVRLEVEQHVGEAERVDRPLEPHRQPRPLDPPVERDAERPVIGVACRRPRIEKVPSRPAKALRGQRELGRGDAQIGEMDDAVGAAGQRRLEPRQPAGHPGEEAIVDPPHPGRARVAGHRSSRGRPARARRAARSARRPRRSRESGSAAARRSSVDRHRRRCAGRRSGRRGPRSLSRGDGQIARRSAAAP